MPWGDSPQYDPRIRFIKEPDPVTACLELEGAALPQGKQVLVDYVGGHFKLHNDGVRTN